MYTVYTYSASCVYVLMCIECAIGGATAVYIQCDQGVKLTYHFVYYILTPPPQPPWEFVKPYIMCI